MSGAYAENDSRENVLHALVILCLRESGENVVSSASVGAGSVACGGGAVKLAASAAAIGGIGGMSWHRRSSEESISMASLLKFSRGGVGSIACITLRLDRIERIIKRRSMASRQRK